MFSRELACSALSQSWLFELETNDREREKWSSLNARVLTRSIAFGELFTRSVIRHSWLVLPGMAHLSGAGRRAYRCHPMVAVAISDWACLSDCGVPKPDSTLRFRNVARLLWLMRVKTMGSDTKTSIRVRLGRWLSVGIVVAAVSLGLVVLYRTNRYPRTDDAEVLANFIGIAPQVEGRIIRLHVRDNQFVKQGELLFEIDEQPYQYALEKAISDQSTLEGQIEDERRKIASQVSAVSVAKANIQGAESDVARYAAAIDQARADVTNAEQGVSKAKAEWEYANNNLHRLEPLLTKQFVTVDQVDQARTSEIIKAQVLKQSEARLRVSQAALRSALAQYDQSKAVVDQSKAQHEQAQHAITTLGPVVNQRGAKKSAVENARYNLENCRVYAPFDARVTNLT